MRRLLVLCPALLAFAGCGPSLLGDGDDENDHPAATLGEALTGPVCPAGTILEGIDVSHYQGTPNWALVAAAGKRFVYTKASQGTGVDPTFAANWAGIKAAGMRRGAYHWFNPATDPVAQADTIIRLVGKLAPGDLPVMADVEEMNGTIPSPAVYTAHLKTWIERVEAGTGRPVMIYTGGYYWQQYLGDTAIFADRPLAVAHYTTAACTAIPTPWKTWTMWQYRGNAVGSVPAGKCPGVVGDVDLDHFAGDAAALDRLAGIVPPPPPPPPPADAGAPPPPHDAGSPPPPPRDAGSRPADAGVPPLDAGTPAFDAGPAPPMVADSGTPPELVDDAGQVSPPPARPDAGTPAALAGPSDTPATGACGCGAAPLPGLLWALALLLRRRSP